MKTRNNQPGEMPDFAFDVWVNDQADFFAGTADHDETGSFDDNWIVSAGDLFRHLELPLDEPVSFHDEAA